MKLPLKQSKTQSLRRPLIAALSFLFLTATFFTGIQMGTRKINTHRKAVEYPVWFAFPGVQSNRLVTLEKGRTITYDDSCSYMFGHSQISIVSLDVREYWKWSLTVRVEGYREIPDQDWETSGRMKKEVMDPVEFTITSPGANATYTSATLDNFSEIGGIHLGPDLLRPIIVTPDKVIFAVERVVC